MHHPGCVLSRLPRRGRENNCPGGYFRSLDRTQGSVRLPLHDQSERTQSPRSDGQRRRADTDPTRASERSETGRIAQNLDFVERHRDNARQNTAKFCVIRPGTPPEARRDADATRPPHNTEKPHHGADPSRTPPDQSTRRHRPHPARAHPRDQRTANATRHKRQQLTKPSRSGGLVGKAGVWLQATRSI